MIALTSFSREAVQAIQDEFMRAQKKHPGRTPAEPGLGHGDRLAILGEEFGEVCTALTYDRGDPDELERELIQLATMSLAWWSGLQTEKCVAEKNAEQLLVDAIAVYAEGDSVLIFDRIRLNRQADGKWHPLNQYSRLSPRTDKEIDEMVELGEATIICPTITYNQGIKNE